MSTGPGHAPPPSLLDDLKQISGACLAVAVIILLAVIITALAIPPLLPAGTMTSGTDGGPTNAATWANLIGFQILATLLMVLFVDRRFAGQVAFTLALGPPRVPLSVVAQTLVVIAVALALLSLFSYGFFYEDMLRDLRVFQKIMADTPTIVPMLALVIGAPVCEEILFRGFLLNRLAHTRLGFVGASILATLGWTVLHFGYSAIGLVEVFAAGLLFSWALWRTGSLWVPIVFHAIYNAIVFVIISTIPLPPPAKAQSGKREVRCSSTLT